MLALVVNPPAPPGIAAFAPQASKPITKAPPAQSARFGSSAGGQCSTGKVCSRPSASPSGAAASLPPGVTAVPTPTAARGVPSALQCYTWPDGTVTQTYDPQSPPCIATWDDSKGNGGATWPGVTATEDPRRGADRHDRGLGHPPADRRLLQQPLPALRPQDQAGDLPSQQANQQFGGNGYNDPSLQRSDAAAVTQLKVFAATDFVDPLPASWSLPVYRDTLTKHKILSLSGGEVPPYGTSAGLAAKAPYEWTYYPALDTVMDGTATMICRQLAGKKAQYAKGNDPVGGRVADKTRKFAIVLPEQQFIGGPMPGLTSLQHTLAGCGAPASTVVQYDPNDPNKTSALTASMQQLRRDGVTSIVFVPFTGAANPYSPQKAADRAQFYPEWVTVGWSKYTADYQLYGPAQETGATFGVSTWNKMPQAELEFWWRAYLDAGGNPSASSANAGRAFYNELLLLASGIQLAGPHLTPQTFAAGLQSTTFPNPGAAGPPYYQGTVGFTPGDPTMVNDLSQFWLDTRTSAQGVGTSKNLNNSQAECYALLGRRWTPDAWPAHDSYYRGGCR